MCWSMFLGMVWLVLIMWMLCVLFIGVSLVLMMMCDWKWMIFGWMLLMMCVEFVFMCYGSMNWNYGCGGYG